MYYHSHDIKYITCGKVYPPPMEASDQDFLKAYKWLSKYCGYCPQIWLGRSKSCLTGYKCQHKSKKRKFYGERRNSDPQIMFSFDIIKGFPVDFNIWGWCLNPLMRAKDPVKEGDDLIKNSFDSYLKSVLSEEGGADEIKSLPISDPLYKWMHSTNYEDFLSRYFFVENDQVVVPSLNLKAAKEIFCRNEKQVKTLRHMGFIQDRIKILNSKQWN